MVSAHSITFARARRASGCKSLIFSTPFLENSGVFDFGRFEAPRDPKFGLPLFHYVCPVFPDKIFIFSTTFFINFRVSFGLSWRASNSPPAIPPHAYQVPRSGARFFIFSTSILGKIYGFFGSQRFFRRVFSHFKVVVGLRGCVLYLRFVKISKIGAQNFRIMAFQKIEPFQSVSISDLIVKVQHPFVYSRCIRGRGRVGSSPSKNSLFSNWILCSCQSEPNKSTIILERVSEFFSVIG